MIRAVVTKHSKLSSVMVAGTFWPTEIFDGQSTSMPNLSRASAALVVKKSRVRMTMALLKTLESPVTAPAWRLTAERENEPETG